MQANLGKVYIDKQTWKQRLAKQNKEIKEPGHTVYKHLTVFKFTFIFSFWSHKPSRMWKAYPRTTSFKYFKKFGNQEREKKW